MGKGTRNAYVILLTGDRLPVERATKEQLDSLPRIVTNKRGVVMNQISRNDMNTMNQKFGIQTGG